MTEDEYCVVGDLAVVRAMLSMACRLTAISAADLRTLARLLDRLGGELSEQVQIKESE